MKKGQVKGEGGRQYLSRDEGRGFLISRPKYRPLGNEKTWRGGKHGGEEVMGVKILGLLAFLSSRQGIPPFFEPKCTSTSTVL